METECRAESQFEALARLREQAPGVPFLALGQTVFWDEPMKMSVLSAARAFGDERPFVAGVHDTDYFAKLHQSTGKQGYQTLAHNDTTTQTLWSAAGEVSALFGSETVVRREYLSDVGVRLGRIQRQRPGFLDGATEAFGWRGVVAMDSDTRVVAETAMNGLFPTLYQTFDWAINQTVESVAGSVREQAQAKADELRAILCDAEEGTKTLSCYFRRLIKPLYKFAGGEDGDISTTATTDLLKFNSVTCHLDRFAIVNEFLDPLSRGDAVRSYNEAVAGSEIYTLDRFGSWALPFDLLVPGHGRGTIRVAPKAIIIMAPKPLFITLKKPVTSVRDLAIAIEQKFGPDCTLIGKAVTLIGMLSREFVFVFHEGGSGYVGRSRKLHQLLFRNGSAKPFHPILRVRYEAWDALEACTSVLALPEVFRKAFGKTEWRGPEFAARYREVITEQKQLTEDLRRLRKPSQFIHWLAERDEAGWKELARAYDDVHADQENLNGRLASLRTEKHSVLQAYRSAKADRNRLEHEKGVHWRDRIFEKQPTANDLATRDELIRKIQQAAQEALEFRQRWRELDAEQKALTDGPEAESIHERRREIELEADLKRIELARAAITITQGLPKAAHRPAAWWFPLVCPPGGWFRETARRAEYYLEPLA